MNETEATIALNMIPRLGPVRLRKLLSVFGSPQRILEVGAAELAAVEGVGREAAKSIASWREHVKLDAELKAIERLGIHVVIPSMEAYPQSLKEIHDPPIVLYVWGGLLPRDRHAIGVVGTRKPSHYAQECAKKISYQMAYSGLTVVSGLARGVDTLAHQGALAAKGRTIAVLGSGLGALYPPENRALAERIADSGGAVISEFPMATGADRQTFPMRNRIISGCSIGILVVEAGARSGALITTTQAAEQGRSIYAIPGQITNPAAIGTNRLIQQGAKLVTDAGDILEDFQLLFPRQPDLPKPPAPVELSAEENKIWEALGNEELFVDEIIAKSGLPSFKVSTTLLALEIKRLVKQLPGNRYVKTL